MLKTLLAICVVVLLMPISVMASSQDAEKFLLDIKGEMQLVALDEALSDVQKLQKLAVMFDKYVDTQWMGQFVLGSYWRQASAEQKASYIALYQDYLGGNYVPKFRDYVSAEMNILRVQTPAEGSYIIETSLKIDSQPAPLSVSYRVRAVGDSYKITDISGEGVSLINTQRSDFGSAISRKGLEFFLSRLAAKVEKMHSKALAAN